MLAEGGVCCHGPGYSSPAEAVKGPKEEVLFIPCIQVKKGSHDYLATIDVNPESPTYSQVIHRLEMNYPNDELHHSGWNTCSSCYGDPSQSRDKLILAGLMSDRLYVIDVNDSRAPRLHKVIEPEELHALDVSAPHTVHCGPENVIVSTMGKANREAQGSFILIDPKEFVVKGKWSEENTEFGYDFWYQPRHNVMISSEWGAPSAFREGFNLDDVMSGRYGHSLHVWDWTKRQRIQTIDLGKDGIMPLEIRFLHNPTQSTGYVGCALTANVFRFHRLDDGSWTADKVIDIPSWNVNRWALPQMPGIITDILISMDDRFLYVSNWVQGDIRQYDITDPAHPRQTAQLYLGGCAVQGSAVEITDDGVEQPPVVIIADRRIEGGPQMLQLSLDGKRLYVTTSLFSPWDRQFYPEMVAKGSVLLKIDINIEKGGMNLDRNFLVDFASEPNGPVLAHEIRYPGGDCSSDIWL